jgi:hypothetical protein
MKKNRLYLLIGCVAFTQSACSYPAQDELECVLPNGDKFELVAKYDYEPLSYILKHIGDVAERLNQQRFDVFFVPIDEKKWPTPIAGLSHASLFRSEKGRQEICSNFTFIRNTHTATYKVHLPTTEVSKDFQIINTPTLKFDAIKKMTATESLQPYFPTRGYFGLLESKLIMERPLINLNVELDFTQPIEGVFQITSADNGQTWSNPVVTKDSKLFVIGKSLFDQPGIAKPGKYKIGPGR